MNFFEIISSALHSIRASKMRSAFTMFGIVVGIASVMMITSVGDGFRNTMTGFFEDMGVDEIDLWHTSNVRPIEWHERMTTADARFLADHPNVSAVTANAAFTNFRAVDVLNGDPRAVAFRGIDQYRQLFSGIDLIAGRHINASDVASVAQVIIIDESFANRVFGTSNPYQVLGNTIDMRTHRGVMGFTVIGMLESNDMFEMMDMFDMPMDVFVPLSWVQLMQNLGDVVGGVSVRVYDTDIIHQTVPQLVHLMEVRKDAPDVFNASSMASALQEMDAVIGVFTVFLTMVASISLLVGGIGVMNIMLVSVTERTREIGIRKSLGATTHSIVFQFLIEAGVLTAIGGMIGIVFGYVGGLGVGQLVYTLLNMVLIPTLHVQTVVVIVTISALIGIGFGVYPARKASKLDPVESLRFE